MVARFGAVEALHRDDPAVFISLATAAEVRAHAEALDRDAPLAGWLVAVEDNIDAVPFPTTAACEAFERRPARSATVVERAEAGGAVIVGKTNLDQFATGLVGTRSPYGTPRNPVHGDLVPGGSSSGSAVAVARGVVDGAFGTDTAGSGRVPAAQCRIVGLKPTRGRLPATGVVPAVRTVDAVSVFARSVGDAWRLFRAVDGDDGEDPLGRRRPRREPRDLGIVGVPVEVDLDGPLDRDAWERTIAAVAELGVDVVEVDVSSLVEAGTLLYDGPWVVERAMVAGPTAAEWPSSIDPVVGEILRGAADRTAADVFAGIHALASATRRVERIWDEVGVLLLPTTPGPATIAEVEADPIGRNARLGRYTTFANLLDTAVISVPGADRRDGLPFGLSIVGPAWSDEDVAAFGARVLGEPASIVDDDALPIAVVGAHLRGQPLNGALRSLRASFECTTATSSAYRLYELPGGPPRRPGLVRSDGGAEVEVEVWRVPRSRVGDLLATIPSPLGLGPVELRDGRVVHGFLCEAAAVGAAVDITAFGGWRAYLAAG